MPQIFTGDRDACRSSVHTSSSAAAVLSKLYLPGELLSGATEEQKIICPRCSWGLIAFFLISFPQLQISHPDNCSLDPTWVREQSVCNIHANWPQSASYFQTPSMQWWVETTGERLVHSPLRRKIDERVFKRCRCPLYVHAPFVLEWTLSDGSARGRRSESKKKTTANMATAGEMMVKYLWRKRQKRRQCCGRRRSADFTTCGRRILSTGTINERNWQRTPLPILLNVWLGLSTTRFSGFTAQRCPRCQSSEAALRHNLVTRPKVSAFWADTFGNISQVMTFLAHLTH